MKNLSKFYLPLLALTLTFLAALGEYFNLFGDAIVTGRMLIPIMLAFLTLAVFEFLKNSSKENPGFHYIAIIGPPESGKTTIITNLLKTFFEGKINTRGYKIFLKGKNTIEYYNRNISRLDRNIPVQKTGEKDRMSCFLEMDSTSAFFSSHRRVLIGDFPGESSNVHVNNKEDLYKEDNEYMTWIEQADAYVYVVDLGRHLLDPIGYPAEIKRYIRTSWQNILELNSHKRGLMRKKPIVLIFNKADLIQRTTKNTKKDKIKELAFSDYKTPDIIPLEDYEREDVSLFVTEHYSDLIIYLKSQSNKCDSVYMSSFIKSEFVILGFQEFYENAFPR